MCSSYDAESVLRNYSFFIYRIRNYSLLNKYKESHRVVREDQGKREPVLQQLGIFFFNSPGEPFNLLKIEALN